MKNKSSFIFVVAALVAGSSMHTVAEGVTGPSSSASPYLTPLTNGVEFTSILTVGDSVRLKHKGNETYRMVGIPDGLGAYDNNDGTITVLMNHELRNTAGVVRNHGDKGAFVSKWQIRKNDLKVLNGEDLIKKLELTNPDQTAINRLCSADLPMPGAFFNSNTGKGFSEGRIFMSGEEVDAVGRAFAHIAEGRQHGISYELPALGKAAWENLVASPYEQNKTIVAGLDDGSRLASKVYFYVGNKQESGNPVEMAGLTNGISYQLLIGSHVTEATIPNGHTDQFNLVASGGTGLNRVEDGAWDTKNPNRFYFVTTDQFDGNSRLWSATFQDITKPESGGEIKVLIDGAVSGPQMMDNMTVDSAGNVWIQEDVGNQVHLGKIWKFEPTTGNLTTIAQHDAERFISDASADIDGAGNKQSDEESSGIIEVTEMFNGVPGYDTENSRYFLLDVQAHYSTVNGVALDPELVEGGQLLMMKAPK
ncbi:hypothetical protein [Nitrosomonas communis]|uniref:DUF839 domain-containing protein n=1 Tax=Nitrosomonas communis TaxID=44574 RepID=A0A1H2Q1L4_9PROT|nr:hypothetical protein [Nitrosomonas communis]SDW01021.1 hypothetical protein SAMN05421882_1001189 [Nitrosomonas communis]